MGALLKEFGPAESRRKTTLAAINDCIKKLGKKELYDTSCYPKLNIILQVICKFYMVLLHFNAVLDVIAMANTEKATPRVGSARRRKQPRCSSINHVSTH